MYQELTKFNKYVGLPVIILLFFTYLLTGCGETTRVITVVPETIEGVYQFVDTTSNEISGTLALTIDYQGKFDVEELATFRSQNFNGTFGTHPKVNFANGTLLNNQIVYGRDINYTSSNDLEKDGTSSDLGSGKRYTIYNLYFDSNNKLNLLIQIHEDSINSSGGINNLVIERNFKAL